MTSRRLFTWALVFATIMTGGLAADAFGQRRLPPGEGDGPGGGSTDPLVVLGQRLFFDTALSAPNGQSCASCHLSSAGWSDPLNVLDPVNHPTSEGAVKGRFGPRNSPTVAYGDFSPPFAYDATCRCFAGGRYWDGRADTPADQAQGAFLNVLEMNTRDKHGVIREVRRSDYAWLLDTVYGHDIWSDPARAYDGIARALVAYQETQPLNRFSSRYDSYLRGDPTALSPRERTGLQLFEGKGQCTLCHPSRQRLDGTQPLFTSFRYYNLGIPKNPRNRFYDMPRRFNPDGRNFVDLGLGGARNMPGEEGKFKVPTLRNVAATPPYMHNGVFATLQEAVEFHNSRDIDNRWGAPEVPRNMSLGRAAITTPVSVEGARQPLPEPPDDGGGAGRLGNLGLSPSEIDAIVAFLGTLTDSALSAP